MIKPRLTTLQQFASLKPNLTEVARAAPQFFAPDPVPPKALIKWGSAPSFDAEWMDMAAGYDFIALSPNAWTGKKDKMRELRLANPDIMLGMYFQMHTNPPWMGECEAGSYPRKLYDLYNQNSLGFSIWKGFPLYDFFNPSVCKAAALILSEYVAEYKLDWLFLDFCSAPMPDWYHENGDGTWSKEQQSIVSDIWCDYINTMRLALPASTLLIPNGNLAVRHAHFASLVDGMWLEAFPWYNVDGIYPHDLPRLTGERYAKGKGWVFLGNEQNGYDQTPIASQFPGCVAGHKQEG